MDHVWPHVHFLLRWVHLLAGITWIGILYYFNLVQTPFFAKADPAVRGGMVRGLVPEALWWFRHGAMVTFLTGLGMLAISAGVYKQHAALYPILGGAILGITMWWNVWFRIWPNQQIVIQNAEETAAGRPALPAAADAGKRAGLVSRTNFVFSIPMLLLMAAQQNVQPSHGKGWLIPLAVLAAVAVLQWNCLSGLDQPRQKFLGNLKSAMHRGIAIALVIYAVLVFAA